MPRFLMLLTWLILCSTAAAVDYPVVYVSAPIVEGRSPLLQDVFNISKMEAGSTLNIHHPDGTDEVLYDPGPLGGVLDPCVSLDGTKVYVSATKDATPSKFGLEAAINIIEVDVSTRAVRPLTDYTAAGDFATGACEVPGGRLIFTSSENHLFPGTQMDSATLTRATRSVVMQLFALQLDDPLGTREQVGFLNLRGALHPTLLMDGRIMWSSHENHQIRNQRMWGLWASLPDGRKWEPLWSAFANVHHELSSLHFQSQAPNGRIQLVFYYPSKDLGFGNVLDFLPGQGFGHPSPYENPTIADSLAGVQFPFQPIGSRSLTPWTSKKDAGSTGVGYPSGAPDGVLVSSAVLLKDPNRAGNTRAPRDSGVYLLRDAEVSTQESLYSDVIVDEPNRHEVQPRALLSWRQVYGSDPVEHPWLPDAEGKDYGYVGTSGVYERESAPTVLDRTRTGIRYDENPIVQGGDTIPFDNSEIDRVRIVYQAPTLRSDLTKRVPHWTVSGVERMGVLGEIPLRKFDEDGDPIMDAAGNPDTSFLAKIPADVSWTLQLLDVHGRVLTHSRTWHQVRPGEVRTDCRGCHAHHQPGIEFEGTVASQPDYEAADLTASLAFVEWHRDIKPLLMDKCGECHGDTETAAVNGAGFVIDDDLRDGERVVPFNAQHSRLVDVLLADHDAPQMPPEGEPLTAAEIRRVATWVDMGAPVNQGGYFVGLPTEQGDPFDPPGTDPPPPKPDPEPPPPDPEPGDPCEDCHKELERLRELLRQINQLSTLED